MTVTSLATATPTYTAYTSSLGFQGPKDPVAWDGAGNVFAQSVTNNARSYNISVPGLAAPTYDTGFGYTETTSSSAPFQFNSEFVRPGMVPIKYYRDSDSTYRVGVFNVSGTTVSVSGSQPYPAQTSANPGFIRGTAVFPDNPTILLYGNQFVSTAYTVNCYQATVAVDGSLSPLTLLGTVSHTGGAFPGAGTDYLGNVAPTISFSDRLAIQVNTRGLYDRTNPTTIRDGYALIPSETGIDKVRDTNWFADARLVPNHLFTVRRDSSGVFQHVADFTVSADGSTWAVAATWNVPPGTTNAVAGLTSRGKVVAYTTDGTTPRGFYDIFGTPEEFSPQTGTQVNSGYLFVQPVAPAMTGSDDAWLTTSGVSSGTGSMYLMVRSLPVPVPPPLPANLGRQIKPVRYRYVMADIRTGKVISTLPLTSVNFSVGFYSGTEMSGNIYLPDFHVDLMAHPPSMRFSRRTSPERYGAPIGEMFEIGNRAIYIMRNEDVVWGGILWSRNYSSGSKTMQITGMSWDGYIYYRLLRKSIVFLGQRKKKTVKDKDGKDKVVHYNVANVPVYKIWWAIIYNTLHDWNHQDDPHSGLGSAKDAIANPHADAEKWKMIPWTGITRHHSQAVARNFQEQWPNNSPNIELPPRNLVYKTADAQGNNAKEAVTSVNETFRGYDMNKVGEALQQWADTETLASPITAGGLQKFEYRVVSWFDNENQKFRQRYVFGEMTYDPGDPNTPTGIARGIMGKTEEHAASTIFDFPGHIAEWALTEGMEESATRVICTDGGDKYVKHAEYAVDADDLMVPDHVGPGVDHHDNGIIGKNGWLLYDRPLSTNTTQPSVLRSRAKRMLKLCHVPIAASIDDIDNANSTSKKRASQRSTDLTITLYQNPTVPFPDWKLGDWVTFAIQDPFYGGTMYLQRRIVGYSVTVIPDMENNYSHEQIALTLTDDTKIADSS